MGDRSPAPSPVLVCPACSWRAGGLPWLVATAEDRLSFKRNPHTSFAAASDCRTIAIYEYAPIRFAAVSQSNESCEF